MGVADELMGVAGEKVRLLALGVDLGVDLGVADFNGNVYII